jgi:glycosyltransferase involved in cell wall biosynthesis
MSNNLEGNTGIKKLPIFQPFFSVVITTRNRATLLKRALNSLISQKEKDWEAIIVDDGSTDDTNKQILPYLRSWHSIRYVYKPHSGHVSSRNFGIKSSCGRYITFLDSDDEYDPRHLEYRKKFLIQNHSVRFIYGGAKIIGNQFVPDKNDPSVRINLNDCVIGGTFIIEREVILLHNGFRAIVLGSDSDLFERLKKSGIEMAEIKQPTYIYHHDNEDSITNKLYNKVYATS